MTTIQPATPTSVPNPNTQIHTLKSGGLVVTIGISGIVSISLNDVVLTSNTQLPDAPLVQGLYNSNFFKSATTIPAVSRKSIAAIGDLVQITEVYGQYSVLYTYLLSGNDLSLQVDLANDSLLSFTNFSVALPTFNLGPNPTGNMLFVNASYVQANPALCFHPSLNSPVAVSFVTGTGYSVAFHSKSHFDKPVLFAAFSETMAGLPSTATISAHVQDTIPASQAMRFTVNMHITNETVSVPTICASYVTDIRSFLGPMQYTVTDNRGFGQFSSIDQSWVTSTNPYGYNGDQRRLDTSTGIGLFEQMVSPLIGNAQGIIFWQPQGIRSSANYRADFDCWDSPQQITLPALFKSLINSGLKVGLLAQPSLMLTPLTYTADTDVILDGRNDSQVQMLITRFKNVMAFGVSVFYFDSFGGNQNDALIGKQLRSFAGLGTQFYSEYMTDLLLPYSGIYAEPDGNLDGGTGHYSAITMAIFRAVYPNCMVLMKQDGPTPPTSTYFMGHKYMPLTFDSNAGGDVPFYTEVNSSLTNDVWA